MRIRSLFLTLAPLALHGQPEMKPNIIVLYIDDLRFDALGCLGNNIIKTPNIDRIATKGAIFKNAYAVTSISSPSRAAMLTGQYGSKNGVPDLHSITLKNPQNTIAARLKKTGYNTALIGKWHLENDPKDCGFDHSVYFISNGDYYNRNIIRNGKEEKINQFIENFNVSEAIGFIKKQENPYFLFLCSQLPHMDQNYKCNIKKIYADSKVEVPQSHDDNLNNKPNYLKTGRHRLKGREYGYQNKDSLKNHIEEYYSAITALDYSLGKLFHYLDSTNSFENTILFIMSDNGWFIGEHGFTSKVLAYEPSIRVPLIVAGKGVTKKVYNDIVLNIDLAPTISDFCNIQANYFDGVSFKNLLFGKAIKDWRTGFVYEATNPELGSYPMYAYVSPERKYIQTFDIYKRDSVIFQEEYDLINDKDEMKNIFQTNSSFDKLAIEKIEYHKKNSNEKAR